VQSKYVRVTMGRAVCQPLLPIASHERETSSARYGKNVGEGCLKTRSPETDGVTGGREELLNLWSSRSNEEGLDGQGMWHAWELFEILTKL
jgi:hypothetical protein